MAVPRLPVHDESGVALRSPKKDAGYERLRDRLARLGALATCEELCRRYGCTLREVLSHVRDSHVACARHHIWALLRWNAEVSLPTLGKWFQRDHTTVRSGVLKHEVRINELYGGAT